MGNPYSFRDLCRDVRLDLRCCGAGSWIGKVAAFLWGTAFQLLLTYRLSRWFASRRMGVLCAPLKWLQYSLAGSEISPQACLGHFVRFPHPSGIIIGAGVVIEGDAWIFQQVTIGSHGRFAEEKNYPVIGRGVRLYTGAKVVGGVRIGAGAVVGANAVVLQDVPDGATAVGVPARVVGK